LPEVESSPLFLGEGVSRYYEEIMAACGTAFRQAPKSLWTLRASAVCELARPLLEQGHDHGLHTLLPVYVRNTDSELKLGPQKKG
jgi:tRNA A37 threonylcarbamoyladenosine modification protein TsaB